MRVPKIGILGHGGRMGQHVVALLEESPRYKDRAALTAIVSRSQSPALLMGCDVVIDFSSPEGTLGLARLVCEAKAGPALVVASTGWSPQERLELETAALFVPVMHSANFALGVLAFMEILKQAAPLLDSLGYTPVITEAHHGHKKDAPSGTAILLQRIISKDPQHPVQTHSIRAGEVIGDHKISFYGTSDEIELNHSAKNRDIFARGAIDVALWLHSKRSANSHFSGMIPIEFFFSDLKASKPSV